MVPSSPQVPCMTGKTTSMRWPLPLPSRRTSAASVGSAVMVTRWPERRTSGSIFCAPVPISQWPSLVMPMGTASYLSGSRPRITEAAEARETSCSPERPPKRTPMRNRFLSGVMEIAGFGVFECQFLVIGQRGGDVAGEVEAWCGRGNGDWRGYFEVEIESGDGSFLVFHRLPRCGNSAGGTVSSQNEKGGRAIYENFVRDLRYAIRTMRRDYGFAIFAILIVGLGVGASCTVFSVVNTLLLRPLPFRDPGKLVWMANHKDDTNDMSGKTVQVNYLLDYREKNQSFEDMAAYFAFYGAGDWKLIGDGQPERLTSVPVTQNFFPLLGVKPQLGRSFTVEECKWRGPRVMMITDSLWRRKFAADPNIVGKALPFEGGAMTVVEVLPASFDFGTIFTPGSSVDMYEPCPLSPETNRWGNTIAIIGRLKPGASVGTAQAEAAILGKQLEQLHRDMNDFEPKISMLSEHVSGRVRPAVLVLASAVGVVMLIVCANLSNLLLARGASRQKEIAIRAALGAGKARLIGQMLTESVVLSCCGAVVGLALAIAGTKVLARLTAMNIPM